MDHLLKLKTFTTVDVAFDIYVNGDGRFFAYMTGDDPAAGRPLQNDTKLSALEEVLQGRARRAARARLDIPLLVERRGDDAGLVQCRVYGLHAGTGNLMVLWPDGTKEQLVSGYDVMRSDMPAEDVARFNALTGTRDAVARELQALRSRYRKPFKQVIEEARALAQAAASPTALRA